MKRDHDTLCGFSNTIIVHSLCINVSHTVSKIKGAFLIAIALFLKQHHFLIVRLSLSWKQKYLQIDQLIGFLKLHLKPALENVIGLQIHITYHVIFPCKYYRSYSQSGNHHQILILNIFTPKNYLPTQTQSQLSIFTELSTLDRGPYIWIEMYHMWSSPLVSFT